MRSIISFLITRGYGLLLFFAIIIIWPAHRVTAQTSVDYSTLYFGPNALPVQEFTDATIPRYTTIRVSGDYYFGFGDKTQNLLFTVDIPLLPRFVSLKVWTTLLEHYQTTPEVLRKRNVEEFRTSGRANGDFYIKTRMLLLTERENLPSIILNSTLKTASGTNFKERRYFDTPGYYFDMEVGKTITVSGERFLRSIRGVVNFGFLCWETTNSTQNDAPMYGAKIIMKSPRWELENTLAGYRGWMENGDRPLVFSSMLTYKLHSTSLFTRYQYGINDYPFHLVQVGISAAISSLTVNYPAGGE